MARAWRTIQDCKKAIIYLVVYCRQYVWLCQEGTSVHLPKNRELWMASKFLFVWLRAGKCAWEIRQGKLWVFLDFFFLLPLLCENKKGPKSISLFLFLVCYFSGIVCVGCFMSMDIIFRLWESHKMQHSMLNKTYVSITWGKNNLFAWKLLNCIFFLDHV